jgi:hypothetical protein
MQMIAGAMIAQLESVVKYLALAGQESIRQTLIPAHRSRRIGVYRITQLATRFA